MYNFEFEEKKTNTNIIMTLTKEQQSLYVKGSNQY